MLLVMQQMSVGRNGNLGFDHDEFLLSLGQISDFEVKGLAQKAMTCADRKAKKTKIG